ncbi:hypothetical protein AVEN_129189-2-1, partial [Araneus ventricosus]
LPFIGYLFKVPVREGEKSTLHEDQDGIIQDEGMQKRGGKDDEVFVDTDESKIQARLEPKVKGGCVTAALPIVCERMFEEVVMDYRQKTIDGRGK